MFASGSMQGGGAERVISILANEFVARGLEVAILVVRGDSVYALDPRVRIVRLYEEAEFNSSVANKISRRLVFPSRLLARLSSEQPDVVIPVHGGGWNGRLILAAKALGLRVIAAEHITHKLKSREIVRWLERRIVYRLADGLTVLTRSDLTYYSSYLPRTYLLPNPLGLLVNDQVSPRVKTILAAGRLNSWSHKGFDNLLKIFAQIANYDSEWRLLIAGTGDEGLRYLKTLAVASGVADRIDFLGFREDIDRIMRESSIFALSSRFEGLHMVLLEAMSQGCACISFDCDSGPADIIDDEVDGLLVRNQDNEAFGKALLRLMADEQLRKRLSEAGQQKARTFAAPIIADRWIKLFAKMPR